MADVPERRRRRLRPTAAAKAAAAASPASPTATPNDEAPGDVVTVEDAAGVAQTSAVFDPEESGPTPATVQATLTAAKPGGWVSAPGDAGADVPKAPDGPRPIAPKPDALPTATGKPGADTSNASAPKPDALPTAAAKAGADISHVAAPKPGSDAVKASPARPGGDVPKAAVPRPGADAPKPATAPRGPAPMGSPPMAPAPRGSPPLGSPPLGKRRTPGNGDGTVNGARPTSGAGAGGDDQSERGLRGLVGSGSSQVSVTAAMRARDAARPTDDDLAEADATLTIVRRNWVPREDLPRGR
jgi:hypothetical protein